MLTKQQILDAEAAGGVITTPPLNLHQIALLDIPIELRKAMIKKKKAEQEIIHILLQYEKDVKI